MTSMRPSQITLEEVMKNHLQFTENPIAVLDPQDRFIFHNPAFVKTFGLDPSAMDGWAMDDWLSWMYRHRGGVNIEKESLQAWLDYVHSVSRSKPFRRFETDLIDGRWLLVSEQSYPSGHLVLHFADITLQKKTEQELKEAIAKIEHIAQTDELTGLPNRRHILGRFHEELMRAARYQHAFCFGILDIDHFKQVNDSYGHPVGDQVLKHFAKFVRDHLRSQDMVGRVGGEEFAVLFPETELDDAMLVLRRIGDALQQEHLTQIAPDFSYTFSAGLASTQEDLLQDCNALMAKADKALYQAKHAGRNRVLRYQEEPG